MLPGFLKINWHLIKISAYLDIFLLLCYVALTPGTQEGVTTDVFAMLPHPSGVSRVAMVPFSISLKWFVYLFTIKL